MTTAIHLFLKPFFVPNCEYVTQTCLICLTKTKKYVTRAIKPNLLPSYQLIPRPSKQSRCRTDKHAFLCIFASRISLQTNLNYSLTSHTKATLNLDNPLSPPPNQTLPTPLPSGAPATSSQCPSSPAMPCGERRALRESTGRPRVNRGAAAGAHCWHMGTNTSPRQTKGFGGAGSSRRTPEGIWGVAAHCW